MGSVLTSVAVWMSQSPSFGSRDVSGKKKKKKRPTENTHLVVLHIYVLSHTLACAHRADDVTRLPHDCLWDVTKLFSQSSIHAHLCTFFHSHNGACIVEIRV